MNAREFLSLVLPDKGYINISVQNAKSGGWKSNTPHDTIDTALEHAAALLWRHENIYFGIATYRAREQFDAKSERMRFFRTHDNSLYIKTFVLDLDVDADDPKKHPSKEAAIAALQAFCAKVNLPRPMLVDSGGGIHVYWVFTEPVECLTWRAEAIKLKAVCTQAGLLTDNAVTSDQARVLRLPGTANLKKDTARMVRVLCGPERPLTFHEYQARFDQYLALHGVAAPILRDQGAAISAMLGSNIEITSTPSNFAMITFGCGQVAEQYVTHGQGADEPLWRATLGIAKFCHAPERAMALVSNGHAEYDEANAKRKMEAWNAGPTTCAYFEGLNPGGCAGCVHKGKITSPIVLGRAMREAEAPAVEEVNEDGDQVIVQLPDPPKPYVRSERGQIVIQTEDADGVPEFSVISPNDFYPIKIMRQSGLDSDVSEVSIWRMHLDRMAPVDVPIEHTILNDSKKISGFLSSKGIYPNAEQAKGIQNYMSAYLQQLAKQVDREKLYERLGWHDDRATFVLGGTALHRGAPPTYHKASKHVRAVTKDGLHPAGTLEGWKQAMRFYNTPTYQGHRFFLYASLAAPIFHMTGHKGVLLSASGESGRGKTTCLLACGSIWGAPDSLLVNGNRDGTTINALYTIIGTYHSLPFLWDDLTERPGEEIRQFALNLPQGKGKERMKGNEHDGRTVTWETVVLSSSNADEISRIFASNKEAQPHAMRLIGVEFRALDISTNAKIAADQFIRDMRANYGHAGLMFMDYVLRNYDSVQEEVRAAMLQVDQEVQAQSQERYWTALVACAYVASRIAARLGLWEFPYETDRIWMQEHIGSLRKTVTELQETAEDILVDFLEAHQPDTLVISAKSASTLDNIAVQPKRSLLIRHEVDANLIFVSRSAMQEYCSKMGINFKKLQDDLMRCGVLANRSIAKTLGADTAWARGQSPCWKIDVSRMGVDAPTAPAGAAPAAPAKSNVVPMRVAAQGST